MAEFSENLDIASAVLQKRFKFLSTRAEWHLQAAFNKTVTTQDSSVMHRACAATLLRDAGAAALILGRPDDARSKFAKAGRLRLELGFYDGLYLLRLAGSTDEGGFYAWVSKSSSWLERSLTGDPDDAGLPQYAVTASRSPRQLVSVIQAGIATSEQVRDLASKRLTVYASYALGVTQTPVTHYMSLLQEMSAGQLLAGRNTLIGMSIAREALISAAQNDRFHWRLARKPAELIDMDLLALGLIALEQSEELFSEVSGIVGEIGIVARIPFDAALLLKNMPPRDTPLQAAFH